VPSSIFHKSDEGKCFVFREGEPAGRRYQYAAFGVDHSFVLNAKKCLIFDYSSFHGWQH
jgi:hypothetical protein